MRAWHSQLNSVSIAYLPLGKNPQQSLAQQLKPSQRRHFKMSRDNVMLYVALIFYLWID